MIVLRGHLSQAFEAQRALVYWVMILRGDKPYLPSESHFEGHCEGVLVEEQIFQDRPWRPPNILHIMKWSNWAQEGPASVLVGHNLFIVISPAPSPAGDRHQNWAMTTSPAISDVMVVKDSLSQIQHAMQSCQSVGWAGFFLTQFWR